MKRQMIIAVGREFGSGGHKIAENIARQLEISYYDRKILEDISEEKNIHIENLKKYDEKRRKIILSRKVKGFTNSIEEIVAEMQFRYLRDKAESGESFVIVGRCADALFRGDERLVSIFVVGDRETKIKRVMDSHRISREEAINKMEKMDKTRMQYHNRHSDVKWADPKGYDICVNSSKLGFESTANILVAYIKEYFEER